MASLKTCCVDKELGQEACLDQEGESHVTSVGNLDEKVPNGDHGSCTEHSMSKEEELEISYTTADLIFENPSSFDIKMPVDSSDFSNFCDTGDLIAEDDKNDNARESIRSTTISVDAKSVHSLERETSYENTSTESFSSDPSFGNTTDEQVDSANENGKHSCLAHPDYKLALSLIEGKDHEILELRDTVLRLKELLSVETQKSTREDELEQRLAQYQRELDLTKKEQEIDKRTFETAKKEWDLKYASLKKEFETAKREKENMVMRYAISEKELIDVKKEKELLAKKLKDSNKECESLMDKVKTLVAEKSKLSQSLDTKSTDLANANKEIDKLKEEINSRDIKIKWTQNKLKTEMETHKDCPVQLEKLMSNIRNLEEELSSLKVENQNLKKEVSETEQNKALESQLKEEQAKLIMERHEHSEIHSKYKTLQTKHQSIIEENNSLSFQVQRLETERLEMESKLSSSREETEKLSNLVSDLQSNLVEMDSLKSRLKESEDKVKSLQLEMERVRRQNEELLQDMSSCRAKESEMLSFTQKLTTKNVQLQSEFSTIETKASDLEKTAEKCKNEVKELKEQINELESQLSREKARREEETRLLARQVAEKKKKGELTEAELQDTKAMLTQVKNKHGTVVKDLHRELCQLRKKLEKSEAPDSLRASDSLSSLTETSVIQAVELPTQNLVERILRLQSENAKLSEKLEFLEEHSAHLLSELQRKSRLLQSYVLREEAGALAPSSLDNHKVEVSKHGGIMASIYGGSPQDDGMSLELCLEINRKLQAVLEDTLLKNIMLKENIDTLGDEISRLTGGPEEGFK